MNRPQLKVKSFEIRKRLMYEAWEKVQANGGAPGVDAVRIQDFAANERANLYKLWICRVQDYGERAPPEVSRGWSGCLKLSEDSACLETLKEDK